MQPQTLQYATILFYINAVFGVLFGSAFYVVGLLVGLVLVAGEVLSGLGIANSFKWGYQLAIVVSGINLAIALYALSVNGIGLAVINVIFPAALFALVVHPMSRDYQRIWFE